MTAVTIAVTIRDARAQDVEALLDLYGQLGSPADTPSAETALAALDDVDALPGMRLVVAVLDGRPIGTVTMAVLPNLTHHARPFAQVENLVVDSEHRGRGVGRALMAWCEETARAAGCYKVQLQSRNRRREAHRFYRREGYRASSVGFRKYLP